MNDLVFKKEEFTNAIQALVPSYQREVILKTLDQDENYNFENDIKQLTGEIYPKGMIRKTSAKNIDDNKNVENRKSIYNEIKKEMYDFLCTKSTKYKTERNKSVMSVENIISIIATSVAGSFGIGIGVITGAITIYLISILKIGKNVWCSVNQPS